MRKRKSKRSESPTETLLLFLKYFKPGEYPLHEAVASEELPRMQRLLRDAYLLESRLPDGDTPLHFAAANGLSDAVELLLSSGADVNAKANDGDTPHPRATNKAGKNPREVLEEAQRDDLIDVYEDIPEITSLLASFEDDLGQYR